MGTLPSTVAVQNISGQIASSPVNSNYSALQAAVNGLIDVLDDGVSGQYLTGNGSTLTWQTPATYATILDRSTATVDVANTVAETSVYSKAVAANTMGVDKKLKLRCVGDMLNNDSATRSLTLRIYFGGSVVYANTFDAFNAISAVRQRWILDLEIANVGAANSQDMSGLLTLTMTGDSAPATGIGELANTLSRSSPFGVSTLLAVDTTLLQTLDVRVAWSAASANLSFKKRYATLEVV